MPPMMLVIMVSANLTPLIGSGPLYPAEGFEPFCKTTWWVNLLFVNNLVDVNKMVRVKKTLYLSCYTKMCHVIVLLIVFGSLVVPRQRHAISLDSAYRHFSVCIGPVASRVQSHWVHCPNCSDLWKYRSDRVSFECIPWIGAWCRHFRRRVTNRSFSFKFFYLFRNYYIYRDPGDFFNKVYITPWCRAGPYFVGVLLGYILFIVKDKKIKINWVSFRVTSTIKRC